MRQPTNNRNSIALNSHRQPFRAQASTDDTKTLAEAIAQPATSSPSLRGEELVGEKLAAFLNGKEGRVGFRKDDFFNAKEGFCPL